MLFKFSIEEDESRSYEEMQNYEDNLITGEKECYLESFEEDKRMDMMLQMAKDLTGSEGEERLSPESDEIDEEQYQVNFAHG